MKNAVDALQELSAHARACTFHEDQSGENPRRDRQGGR